MLPKEIHEFAIIPVLAGALAELAWQVPFFLYGAAFLAMGAIYPYVQELVVDSTGTESIRASLGQYARSITNELSAPSLIVMMVGGFVRFFSLFAFLTFVLIFAVREIGAIPFQAGLIVAMSGIRILLSPTQAGEFRDSHGGRLYWA